MKTKYLYFFVILIFTLILSACNNNMDENAISSASTEMSSENYPHTTPILLPEPRDDQGNGNGRNVSFQQNQEDMAVPAPEQYQAQPQQEAKQQPKQQQQNQAQQQDQQTEGLSEAEAQVIELTNAERRKNGLPDLKADTSVSNVARKKSEDMQANNYFSHTSPTYGSPFDMMRDFGVSYNSAGENIAQGQRTPEEVVQAWMNSEGHRKNILSQNFTHIGVGYEQNEHTWTQMFISK